MQVADITVQFAALSDFFFSHTNDVEFIQVADITVQFAALSYFFFFSTEEPFTRSVHPSRLKAKHVDFSHPF